MSFDEIGLTPEYKRGIEIFDAEPWAERGPVDELINLQQQAFGADSKGDFGKFGAVTMQMSRIESKINNHSEAAAYAHEAADAFERVGQLDDAIAAHATLAREQRVLDSPDLALASLQEVIHLKINHGEDGLFDIASPIPNEEVQPILRHIKSFTASYLSSGLVYCSAEDAQYPAEFCQKIANVLHKRLQMNLLLRFGA